MMFRGSRTRKAWTSRSASFALSRATVALFQSRPRRSAVAGAGGPSSPGWGLSSRASLRPVLAWEPSVRVRDDGPAPCMAATRSTRERKPEPSSARPPPLIHRRRPVSMHAAFRRPRAGMAARGPGAARPPSPVHPGRMRGLAASARRRAHRPLPVPLARRDGNAHRGLLGGHGAARGRGQGARRRRLQLRRGPARALRGRAPRGVAPALVLARPPKGGGEGAPLVGGPRDGDDRLQPDAVRLAHGQLRRRARGAAGPRRLASPLARVPAADPGPEPLPARRAAAHCRAAWRLRLRGGGGVDALLEGVTGAIVGARSPEQVDGWVAAASLE